MTFFNLTAKEYFGGGVLLLKNHKTKEAKEEDNYNIRD